MKKKQLITMIASLGLVLAVGVGSTLAYLSQQSNAVTNNFFVGDGFDEGDVKVDEEDLDPDATERTKTGNDYKDVLPNAELEKDPQVHVKADSPNSYAFVKITGLDALAAVDINVVDWSASWVKVDKEATLDGVYAYVDTDGNGIMVNSDNCGSAVDGYLDLDKLFTSLKVDMDAKLYDADGNAITLAQIVVKACLVQADEMDYDEIVDGPLYKFD